MVKLSAAQIRKIIKAHNIEATVKIPAGLKKDELEKFVESKGFKINHDEKSISKGGKKITLEQAEKLTAPKQKTALQKQKAAERKEEKAVAQKKKERELKKEAVKKATKGMVPKTSVPKKVGSKPVPKKEEPKKPPRTVKKDGKKFVQFTEKEKKLAKEIQERNIKKGAVKLLTRDEYDKLVRKSVGDITPTEKAQIEKYEKSLPKKKPVKPLTEKEQFFKLLQDAENAEFTTRSRERKGVVKELKKILDKKKTSNFTKAEKEALKKIDLPSNILKNIEETNSAIVKKKIIKKPKAEPKAAPKAEPKKEKPAWLIKAEKERAERDQKQKVEILKQYKDRWEKNFKNQYQWTDAQVKRIEEILFNKNGIKSTGAENVEDPSGFKLFFSVDGKSESSATFKFPKFTQKKKDQSMMKGKN